MGRTQSIWRGTPSACAPSRETFPRRSSRRAADLCRPPGVALHVTCNTMPRNQEVDRLPQWLAWLEDCGVTAVILADVGVLALAQAVCPVG